MATLKERMILDIINCLLSMNEDTYLKSKIVAYSIFEDGKVKDFYQKIYGYVDKRRPLLLEMK